MRWKAAVTFLEINGCAEADLKRSVSIKGDKYNEGKKEFVGGYCTSVNHDRLRYRR